MGPFKKEFLNPIRACVLSKKILWANECQNKEANKARVHFEIIFSWNFIFPKYTTVLELTIVGLTVDRGHCSRTDI